MGILGLVRHSQTSLPNVLERRGMDSTPGRCGPNPCEKPTSSSTFTLPVILGVAVPLIGAAILFLILQRRHTRKIREEDANDRHASLDFGLGDVPQPGRSKRAAAMALDKEKSDLSRRQISMDLTMNNTYLPSLETKNSRESLDSLSIPLRKEDPYRPISQLHASDTASIRSQSRDPSPGNSMYHNSQSRLHGMAEGMTENTLNSKVRPINAVAFPPRHNSLIPFQTASNPHLSQQVQPSFPEEPPQAYNPANPVMPMNGWTGGQHFSQQLRQQPQFQTSSIADNRISEKNSNEEYYENFGQTGGYNTYAAPYEIERIPPGRSFPNPGAPIASQGLQAPEMNICLPSQVSQIPPNYYGNNQEQMFLTQESQGHYLDSAYMNNQVNTNRYSVLGSRPLPPNTITETDDPEMRANRIRSFYKEYFDDNTPAPPGRYEKNIYQNQNNENAYYDPDSNQFVIPYAQPVTRRAMTPPPSNKVVGPGRARNISMGTMDNPDQRRPSNFSHEMGRNISSYGHQPPASKQPSLPFAELNPLPTPGRMKDDSFAINSLEYAPPVTYRERAGSRSGNPFPERRPYSPINNSYSELSALPSPYALQNSGAFSSLDFAPKKFKDNTNNSDAGSIRSNRSGRSNGHPGMTRNGSYHVDQLPNDVIFTKQGLNTTLKPQWNISR